MCILINSITQVGWSCKTWLWILRSLQKHSIIYMLDTHNACLVKVSLIDQVKWKEVPMQCERCNKMTDIQRKRKCHECFMGHNGLLRFPPHTLASTYTRGWGFSWHLYPKHTQRHMVCNSHTSGVLTAVDCGKSRELWIWANCFLIWKFLFKRLMISSRCLIWAPPSPWFFHFYSMPHFYWFKKNRAGYL